MSKELEESTIFTILENIGSMTENEIPEYLSQFELPEEIQRSILQYYQLSNPPNNDQMINENVISQDNFILYTQSVQLMKTEPERLTTIETLLKHCNHFSESFIFGQPIVENLCFIMQHWDSLSDSARRSTTQIIACLLNVSKGTIPQFDTPDFLGLLLAAFNFSSSNTDLVVIFNTIFSSFLDKSDFYSNFVSSLKSIQLTPLLDVELSLANSENWDIKQTAIALIVSMVPHLTSSDNLSKVALLYITILSSESSLRSDILSLRGIHSIILNYPQTILNIVESHGIEIIIDRLVQISHHPQRISAGFAYEFGYKALALILSAATCEAIPKFLHEFTKKYICEDESAREYLQILMEDVLQNQDYDEIYPFCSILYIMIRAANHEVDQYLIQNNVIAVLSNYVNGSFMIQTAIFRVFAAMIERTPVYGLEELQYLRGILELLDSMDYSAQLDILICLVSYLDKNETAKQLFFDNGILSAIDNFEVSRNDETPQELVQIFEYLETIFS